MRKVIFYTWNENETDKLIDGWVEIDALRAKYPDMFPRGLHSDNNDIVDHGSAPCGFAIYDGTDEQFERWKAHYEKYGLTVVEDPDLGDLWAKPIYHATDYVLEYKHIQKIEGKNPTHEQVRKHLRNKARVTDDLELKRKVAMQQT